MQWSSHVYIRMLYVYIDINVHICIILYIAGQGVCIQMLWPVL